MKAGTISYIIYFLLGMIGLPVFSNFSGGFGVVAGPTGGYLIGFIALALICGFFAEKFNGNRWLYVVGMIIGLATLYAVGTAWLAYQSGLTFGAALWAGVIPFIPGDAFKIVIIAVAAKPARRMIVKAVPGLSRGYR
jgi:biotin transport system substrate-specific component